MMHLGIKAYLEKALGTLLFTPFEKNSSSCVKQSPSRMDEVVVEARRVRVAHPNWEEELGNYIAKALKESKPV